jgi:outer membrane murein-binding lipoprotein Lpp
MATASNTQVVSASDYVQSLGSRVNAVQSEIDQNNAKLKNLTDEQQIFQDQLDRVSKIIAYLKKVDPQVHDLKESVAGLLNFFAVKSPSALTPAQRDLKPADDSLKEVSDMLTQIGARLYFSILNTNVCAVAIEATYDMLTKNTKHDPNPDPGTGKVTVDIGPSDDLVNKLNAGKLAGIAALESLANTFISYIGFLNAIEEIKGMATYLTTGFNEELQSLRALENRFLYRSRVIAGEYRLYERDYKKTSDEVKTLTAYIQQLQLDHDLLLTEFNAAMQSIKPGTPAPTVK